MQFARANAIADDYTRDYLGAKTAWRIKNDRTRSEGLSKQEDGIQDDTRTWWVLGPTGNLTNRI
jgi:hypothetical protein